MKYTAEQYLDRIENKRLNSTHLYSREEMIDFAERYAKAITVTHSCKSDSEQLVCNQNELDCPFDFTSRCTMGRCNCKPKAN
jgi:hypothetical protein